jgi:Domain of unknown function (DUF1906)
MSTNSTTARSQGRTEADRATDAANALGLSPQTIIYYDLEQYTTTTTGRAAVKAFVDGWVTRLNERGNEAGFTVRPEMLWMIGRERAFAHREPCGSPNGIIGKPSLG